MNREVVTQNENGFLANGTEEWVEALDTLKRDEPLRREMGRAGRKTVEALYSLQANAPKLAAALREAVRKRTA
jgi:glycosyltransferase involved in cell wall biosynthesis